MGTMETMERRSVKLNEDLYQRIKDIANDRSTWIGNLIDKAVEQYLRRCYARQKNVSERKTIR